MYLELRHLRSLQAIHRTGSLARAAEHLHLTQSALSHQIKALERHFALPLYHRRHRPLRLTAAGEELLALAERLLPEVAAAEQRLRRVAEGDSGRLHITIECHSCFEWLIPTLDRYRGRWPEVEVDIRLGTHFDPLPALARGDIDLVISSDRVALPDIAFAPLFDYEAVAVLARDHPLTARERLGPEDLREQILITYPVAEERLDVFTRFLAPAGVRPAAVRQSELTAMILQLVASRRGIAVLPDWVVADYLERDYVSARPLDTAGEAGEPGLRGTVYAAVRAAEAERASVAGFIALAREALALRGSSQS